MYYPNYNCYLFCLWLSTSSFQKFSPSRTALLATVQAAALAGTGITNYDYNFFVYFTSPYYVAYQQWQSQQPFPYPSSSPDSLTTAWLAHVSSPAAQTIYAVDVFFKQLRNDGNLLLDYCFCFSQDNQANGRVSLINPSLYTITEHGSPTWAANQGYTGNGSSMYLTSNFIESANASNFTYNNGSFGAYLRQSVAAGAHTVMQCQDSSHSTGMSIKFTSNVFDYNLCDYSQGSVSNSVSQGLFAVQRTSSSARAALLNGSVLGTSSQSSTGLVTVQECFMAGNFSGSISQYDINQIAFAFKGSGSINQVLFNSAVNTLMTNLGSHY